MMANATDKKGIEGKSLCIHRHFYLGQYHCGNSLTILASNTYGNRRKHYKEERIRKKQETLLSSTYLQVLVPSVCCCFDRGKVTKVHKIQNQVESCRLLDSEELLFSLGRSE